MLKRHVEEVFDWIYHALKISGFRKALLFAMLNVVAESICENSNWDSSQHHLSERNLPTISA